MNLKHSGALAGALTLFAAVASAEEARTETRTTELTRQVMVMSADGTPEDAHQIVVMSRAVDGAAPSVQVKLLDGEDLETIDLEGLEIGETKSFETESGKEIVVTRTEQGLSLSVDGKDIDIPSVMSLAVGGPGLPGCKALAGSAVSVSGNAITVNGEDKIVLNGAALPHVIVAPSLDGSFENLKSLEGLEPEVREKVVEALHEILSSRPGAMAWTMKTTAPGGELVPGGERVHVRRVVIEDEKNVQ